ncbi:unnamed protein product [Pleuronectes platessa]|uniref:Uncharacterized protein n=1 Tax=Pleuronectes platessa TaxID=8262 RepID=A0A9N7V3I9_PLEPL|nr:unnamed protein product [Pleuronectes platessa]
MQGVDKGNEETEREQAQQAPVSRQDDEPPDRNELWVCKQAGKGANKREGEGGRERARGRDTSGRIHIWAPGLLRGYDPRSPEHIHKATQPNTGLSESNKTGEGSGSDGCAGVCEFSQATKPRRDGCQSVGGLTGVWRRDEGMKG